MKRRSLFLAVFFLSLLLAKGVLFGAEGKYRKNVKHTKTGEVFVDRIPQVAQRKNFCAPASVEMVLRYYNNRITQRLLGRTFETDKDKGTSTQELAKEFERGGLLKDFKFKALYRMTVQERAMLVSAYSRSGRLSGPAEKGKKGKNKKAKADNAASDDVFSKMDPDVAVAVFSKVRAPLQQKLADEIVRYTDAGQPLLWCVHMNFDPIERAQGGHMRIIVGYQKIGSAVTSVLYRDPWGKKPQIKKMPLVRATVMTMELLFIEPRGNAPTARTE